jgi:hypothetical protein
MNYEQALALILSLLSPNERAHAVVYALPEPVSEGVALAAGPQRVVAATRSYIGFVDREPLANWGHPARYLLVDAQTGKVGSIEARFPPFGPKKDTRWRVVYSAAGLPNSILAAPK